MLPVFDLTPTDAKKFLGVASYRALTEMVALWTRGYHYSGDRQSRRYSSVRINEFFETLHEPEIQRGIIDRWQQDLQDRAANPLPGDVASIIAPIDSDR